MEVVALLSQGRTAAAQCGLFTHKSVPVIFEPTCIINKERCLTNKTQFSAIFTRNSDHIVTLYQYSDCQLYGGKMWPGSRGRYRNNCH